MSVVSKPLFTAHYAANAANTEYTSPAAGVCTIIDKMTGYNGTVGAVTLQINLVAKAGAAAATNIIVLKNVAAGEAYNFPEIVGHVLEPSGFISIVAGAATSIVIRASGREVS